MWVVEHFGHPKSLAKPTAFVIVKEARADGRLVEIGRTDSVPNSCSPQFSRPVMLRYRGPEANQTIHVEVLSFAFKQRNGVPLGSCSFTLDDLVHARTARVLKLALMSPDGARLNGHVIMRGANTVAVEDGVWMQLHLAADRLPQFYSKAGKLQTRTYFEIWRQRSDGLVQAYKSEVSQDTSKPSWWPLALCGRRVGDSEDSQVSIRVFRKASGADGDDHAEDQLIGEARAPPARPPAPRSAGAGRRRAEGVGRMLRARRLSGARAGLGRRGCGWER